MKYRFECSGGGPRNIEGTSLEVMYSGSTEMFEKYGLTDVRIQPYEETATVKADPALWEDFLKSPQLAVFTARKKAEE